MTWRTHWIEEESGCANPFRWSTPSSGASGGALRRTLRRLSQSIATKADFFRCGRVATISTRAFSLTKTQLPLDAVADVLKVVPEDARGWPLLSCFEAPSTLLGGRKPSEVLAKESAIVRAAAADFYSDD